MKQVALYVRVSSQQQRNEETIESQKSALLKLAEGKQYSIPESWVFEDDGVSGSTLVRPALEKLRDYAAEGLFDTILMLSPDRLARQYAHQAVILEEFSRHGVNIEFMNSPNQDTPENKLLVQMQGMFAEYERAQIMERSRRGKRYKARKGCVSVLSRAPYGYRYIKADIAQTAHFEINDREASVVRIVFELFTRDRLSMAKITKELESKNIPSPSGNVLWNRTTVHNILKNSAYIGTAHFGRVKKCPPKPNRLKVLGLRTQGKNISLFSRCTRDRSEWIPIPVPVILGEDLYERAQDLLAKNKRLSTRNTKAGSLLQGVASCGECGYSLILEKSGGKRAYSYYRCSRKGGNKCCNRGVRQEQIYQAIWASLTNMLENPELIKREVKKRLSEEKNEPIRLKITQLASAKSQLEIEMDRLLDIYQEGLLSLENFKGRMSKLQHQINDLKRQKKSLDGGVNRRQLLELEDAVQAFSDQLKKSNYNLPLEEKRRILRMLVQEVVLFKDSVTIKHIIPLDTASSGQIARLCKEHASFRTPGASRYNTPLGLRNIRSDYRIEGYRMSLSPYYLTKR